MKMQIVVLVGPIGAGKSEIAKMLERLWLDSSVISISSLIREELEAEGIEPTRQAYCEMSITRREQCFPTYWVFWTVARALMCGTKRLIIDGIRNPVDLQFLTNLGAVPIAVTAHEELRVARVKQRARSGEPETDKQIRQMLKDDMRSGGAAGFNIPDCLPMCGYQFDGCRPLHEQYFQVLLYLGRHGFELNPEEVARAVLEGA